MTLAPSVERALERRAGARSPRFRWTPATQMGVMAQGACCPAIRRWPTSSALRSPSASIAGRRAVAAEGFAAGHGADARATLLKRMKPWAAMTQLSLLEFLPDMMAGRKPLDACCGSARRRPARRSARSRPSTSSWRCSSSFSVADQKRMLELTLDALDEAREQAEVADPGADRRLPDRRPRRADRAHERRDEGRSRADDALHRASRSTRATR